MNTLDQECQDAVEGRTPNRNPHRLVLWQVRNELQQNWPASTYKEALHKHHIIDMINEVIE